MIATATVEARRQRARAMRQTDRALASAIADRALASAIAASATSDQRQRQRDQRASARPFASWSLRAYGSHR